LIKKKECSEKKNHKVLNQTMPTSRNSGVPKRQNSNFIQETKGEESKGLSLRRDAIGGKGDKRKGVLDTAKGRRRAS